MDIQPKWHKQFMTALRYKKKAIVICGNVRDKYLYYDSDAEAVELHNLKQYLIKILQSHYSILKVYDPVKGFADHSRFPKNVDGVNNNKEENKNVEFERPKKSEARAGQNINIDAEKIRNELEKEFDECLIFQFADKAFPREDRTSEDKQLILRLERICEDIRDGNLVIFVYLSKDQIPSEIIINHPDVALIDIGKPERKDYHNLFKSFYHVETFQVVGELVNIADGLSFKEILQTVISIDEDKLNKENIKKFKEAVEQYKYGEIENYWEEIDTDKLDRLFDYFTRDSSGNRGPISGQDNAIKKVQTVVTSAVADIQRITGGNSMSPRGILFFAGPTGVGKTLTAQKLALYLFGSEDCLLRFDMSEYQNESQVQRLYGAPPGYVGYEKGGTLTNAVREKPYSVILFDEIEKAHPRIIDIFLQILDDGRLTDSFGDTVLFSQAIIIFTSNIGDRTKDVNNARINEREELDKLLQSNASSPAIEKHFIKCVRNYFELELSRPELYGRVGEGNIVAFSFPNKDNISQMISNYLVTNVEEFNASWRERLPSLDLTMDTEEVREHLLQSERLRTKMERDSGRGAGREVRDIINETINDKLAIQIINARKRYERYNMEKGSINIFVEDGGIKHVLE